MINELYTEEFVLYTQTIREATDSYTQHKVERDRRRAQKWVDAFLKDREIILTYKIGEQFRTVVATQKCNSARPLPSTPMTKVVVDGKEVDEDQYIRFYSMPDITPECTHIDNVICFFTTNNGINEISAQFNKQGQVYVKSLQEGE